MTENAATSLAADVPSSALHVLSLLEGAGYEAWIVGGWVRDALRGVSGHDVDITSSALWQETAEVLRQAGITVHETGTAHGTVTAVVDDEPIEITTFRVEGAYSDHRHPDEVRFVTDVRDDLARRDFTINAMAYHPERGLLDPFGGRKDLAAGLIRAVGEPAERFAEDALRVLRAVRFACRLGFVVEERTHQALVEAAPGLADIAQERIGREMNGIVASGRVGWALKHEPDVICAAIPEVAAMRGFDQRNPWHAYDVLEHTIHVCNAVEAFTAGVASLALRWAALLHDVGKPATCEIDKAGIGHFYGHPVLSAEQAEYIMSRFGLPSTLVRATWTLIRYHDYKVRPTQRSMRRTLALLEEANKSHALKRAFELMDLKRGDAVSKRISCASYAAELDEMDAILRREGDEPMVLSVRDLAITGEDVLEITGMKPGPMVGMTLSTLLAAVIDGEVPNERHALREEIWHSAMEQE